MLILLTTIHIVVCLFLILVVLLQQGKGADLSVFGGGSTQAAFGARGAATLLHKLTVFGFVAFILTTTGIGLMKGGTGSGSVMRGVDEAAAPAEAAPEAADPLPTEVPETVEPAAGEESTPPADGTETEAGSDDAETADGSGG